MPRCISNIFLANCANILKLCEKASSYYKTATLEQKQRLLKLLCLNLSFDGENVHIYLKSAFGEILKSANLEKSGAEGFEPPNAWTKTRCLTTWRRPITSYVYYSIW